MIWDALYIIGISLKQDEKCRLKRNLSLSMGGPRQLYLSSISYSLTLTGCLDIGIRESELVAKT